MKRIWRFFAFVCLTCQVAMAQNAQLSGLVKDKTGAVIPQAQVTLRNLDTSNVIRAKTDRSGFFIYSSVEPGKYSLSAEAPGFDETVIQGIKLETAANVSRDVVLQVKKSAQEVTVTQQAGQLNTNDGTVSTVVDRTQIENMPLNGKDMQTLFELSPGTVLNAGGKPSNGGGFSVDGQRPTANYLSVDGVSGNAYVAAAGGANVAGTTIATSASGGTNGTLPIDAIEEYRMNTSTYTAENGRTPGGQIQVRTRRGTNQLHGSLFENFRNQVLDATDWFVKYANLAQSQLRMNDFGGTLGGPLLKSKLFFFVAHDTLALNQPATVINNVVPGQALRQAASPLFQPMLAVFPNGNGGADTGMPGFDFFNSSSPYLIRNHTTSVRLDAQFPDSISAFFRVNIAPSALSNINIVAQSQTVETDTYTGGMTVPLGTNLLNEIAINRTNNAINSGSTVGSIGGNNPNALADNVPAGVNLANSQFEFVLGNLKGPKAYSGTSNSNGLTQWNIVDTVSLHRGKHNLKFGGDALIKQITVQRIINEYAVFTATESKPPYLSLQNGIVSTLNYTSYNSQPIISIKNLSLFVNDGWQISPTISINYGLRWEYNPAPSVGPLGVLALQGSSLNPATLTAAVTKKPLYATVYNNFAPRLGFAWSVPSPLGFSTVVRGGMGVYFDTGQSSTVTQAATANYPYYRTGILSGAPYQSISWTGLNANSPPLPQSAVNLVDSGLDSPRTYEWSLTVEQLLKPSTKLSISYVGNDGEKLLGQNAYNNTPNSQGIYPVNPALVSKGGNLYITANQSHSNYQALQMQLTSRIATRLDALASYTWSHAEDNSSTDFATIGGLAANPMAASANDLRHIFATGVHYAPDGAPGNLIVRSLTNGWAFDTIARLQTASPITVTTINSNPNAFQPNADVIPGQPTILNQRYLSSGKLVPGDKLLNFSAFRAPPTDSLGNPLRQGNSPINGYRLFGLLQWDIAASRSWTLWEGINLNFRVDAFNIVNTANFAGVNSFWTSTSASSFGFAGNTYAGNYGSTPSGFGASGAQLAVFQNGGPRSLQLSLKLKF